MRLPYKLRQLASILVIVLAAQLVFQPWVEVWAQSGKGSKGAQSSRGGAAKGPAGATKPAGAAGAQIGVMSSTPTEEQLPGGQALSRAVVPELYVLGPGDGLTIHIWGEYEEQYDLRISPDGKITLPMMGDLPLKGLTLAQAEQLLDSQVKHFYRNVKSGISLSSLRVFEVRVLGAVNLPGSYLATPVRRVSDIVGNAGGVLVSGSQRHIQVHREGRLAATADLMAFLRGGIEAANPYVQDGDVIFVPPIGEGKVIFYIAEISTGAGGGSAAGGGALSENSVPYAIEVEPGERLSTLVNYLGGVSPWWDLESILVQRPTKVPEGVMRIPVNFSSYLMEKDESQNVEILGGDQIFIAASIRRVHVAGAVKVSGAYPYVPGKTADSYVSAAGGPSLYADADRSFIKRADGTLEPYAATAELNNGDTIVLMERLFKTWQDYFALVGTVSGVILGLVGFYAAFTNFGR